MCFRVCFGVFFLSFDLALYSYNGVFKKGAMYKKLWWELHVTLRCPFGHIFIKGTALSRPPETRYGEESAGADSLYKDFTTVKS